MVNNDTFFIFITLNQHYITVNAGFSTSLRREYKMFYGIVKNSASGVPRTVMSAR